MLQQSQPPTWIDSTSWYGFGLYVWPHADERTWGHGGYNPGAQTYFYRWPDGSGRAFFFNTTGQDSNPAAATNYVGQAVWGTLSGITDWPDHDLFPQYYPPRVAPSGVVNGASFQPNALAPGSLVTIFGSDLGGRDSGVTLLWRDASEQ